MGGGPDVANLESILLRSESRHPFAVDDGGGGERARATEGGKDRGLRASTCRQKTLGPLGDGIGQSSDSRFPDLPKVKKANCARPRNSGCTGRRTWLSSSGRRRHDMTKKRAKKGMMKYEESYGDGSAPGSAHCGKRKSEGEGVRVRGERHGNIR